MDVGSTNSVGFTSHSCLNNGLILRVADDGRELLGRHLPSNAGEMSAVALNVFVRERPACLDSRPAQNIGQFGKKMRGEDQNVVLTIFDATQELSS